MEDISEKINRRRQQILVHSCVYYRFNGNLISDLLYDQWSKELAELQRNYPDIAKECVYHEYFQDFDGSTGFDLPIHLPEIVNKAIQLMNIAKNKRMIKYE